MLAVRALSLDRYIATIAEAITACLVPSRRVRASDTDRRTSLRMRSHRAVARRGSARRSCDRVFDVFGLVDVAVEHRGRRGEPREVSRVCARDLALGADWFGGERKQRVDRQRRARRTPRAPTSSPPARRGYSLADPSLERGVAAGRVGVVVDSEHLRARASPQRELADARVGRQQCGSPRGRLPPARAGSRRRRRRGAGGSSRRSARRGRSPRRSPGAAADPPLAASGGALAQVVEEVPDELIGDEQAQQLRCCVVRGSVQNRAAP